MELRRYVASRDGVRVLQELFRDENAVGRSVGIQQRVGSGLRTDSADVDVYWMQNLALLRDIDRPDSYVWLRGHTVMQGNPAPFYLTPTWSLHQEAVRRAGIRSMEAAGFKLPSAPPSEEFSWQSWMGEKPPEWPK